MEENKRTLKKTASWTSISMKTPQKTMSIIVHSIKGFLSSLHNLQYLLWQCPKLTPTLLLDFSLKFSTVSFFLNIVWKFPMAQKRFYLRIINQKFNGESKLFNCDCLRFPQWWSKISIPGLCSNINLLNDFTTLFEYRKKILIKVFLIYWYTQGA